MNAALHGRERWAHTAVLSGAAVLEGAAAVAEPRALPAHGAEQYLQLLS